MSHPSPSLGAPKLSASPSPPPFCGRAHWVVVVVSGVVGAVLGCGVDVVVRIGAVVGGRVGSGVAVRSVVPTVGGTGACVVAGVAERCVVGVVVVFGVVTTDEGEASELVVTRCTVDLDDGRVEVVEAPQAASVAIAAAAIATVALEGRVISIDTTQAVKGIPDRSN